jgi:hypothetical protein
LEGGGTLTSLAPKDPKIKNSSWLKVFLRRQAGGGGLYYQEQAFLNMPWTLSLCKVLWSPQDCGPHFSIPWAIPLYQTRRDGSHEAP